MLYSSALVTYGTGKAVVVATGDKTEIGRISELISNAEVLATPLTRKIAKFSHILLFVILGLATLTFLWDWHTANPGKACLWPVFPCRSP